MRVDFIVVDELCRCGSGGILYGLIGYVIFYIILPASKADPSPNSPIRGFAIGLPPASKPSYCYLNS